MTLRTIKIRDFVKAIELNGYKQTTGTMLRSRVDDDLRPFIFSACAFGQGCLNLGASTGQIDSALIDQETDIGDFIVTNNDENELSCEEIAELVRQYYTDELLDKEITFETYYGYKDFQNYQGVKV